MPSVSTQSDTEGFGIVFLEASACAKPSIAGNCGGQPEAVINNKTGIVVDGENHQEIAEALGKLIQSKELRKQLGENALEFAREHDWKHILSKTLAAIGD